MNSDSGELFEILRRVLEENHYKVASRFNYLTATRECSRMSIQFCGGLKVLISKEKEITRRRRLQGGGPQKVVAQFEPLKSLAMDFHDPSQMDEFMMLVEQDNG